MPVFSTSRDLNRRKLLCESSMSCSHCFSRAPPSEAQRLHGLAKGTWVFYLGIISGKLFEHIDKATTIKLNVIPLITLAGLGLINTPPVNNIPIYYLISVSQGLWKKKWNKVCQKLLRKNCLTGHKCSPSPWTSVAVQPEIIRHPMKGQVREKQKKDFWHCSAMFLIQTFQVLSLRLWYSHCTWHYYFDLKTPFVCHDNFLVGWCYSELGDETLLWRHNAPA